MEYLEYHLLVSRYFALKIDFSDCQVPFPLGTNLHKYVISIFMI